LTTIDRFPNMLSAILQKNNGAAMPWINPQSIGIPRRPFQSRNSLRNPTILIGGMQATDHARVHPTPYSPDPKSFI
jgi:hypothetical protein